MIAGLPAGSLAERVYLRLRGADRPLTIDDLIDEPSERNVVHGLLAGHTSRTGGFARSDYLRTLVGGTRPSGPDEPLQSQVFELLCRRPHTRREIIAETGATDAKVQAAVIFLRKRGPVITSERSWTLEPDHIPFQPEAD